MRKNLFYRLCKFVFFFLFLILTFSCSSKPKDLGVKAENSIEYLEELKENKSISQETYIKAKNHIIEFASKGWLGRYWVLITIIFYLLCILIIGGVCVDSNQNRANPYRKKIVYTYWLLGGIFGLHLMSMNNSEDSIINDWFYFFVLLFICAICFNYSAIMYYYTTPILFLFHKNTWAWNMPSSNWMLVGVCIMAFLFIVNIIIGFFTIPYYVYLSNAKRYRVHFSEIAILNGKEIEEESFIPNLKTCTSKIDEEIQFILESINEGSDTLPLEDEDKGFWGSLKSVAQNVITLGKSKELEKAKKRLNFLKASCESLQSSVHQITFLSDDLYEHLEAMRKAAYRNLFLAKELINIIKDNIKSKQHNVMIDENQVNLTTKGDQILTNENFGDFDSGDFFNTMSYSIDRSLQTLNEKIETNGELSKEDWKSTGLELAIDTLGNSIEYVLEYNTHVSEQLKLVNVNIEEAIQYINRSINNINNAEKTIFRELEILSSLIEGHKAFIHAYVPLRNMVFGKPSLKKFLFGMKKEQKLYQSHEFNKDLQHLMLVCRYYNKINEAKV